MTNNCQDLPLFLCVSRLKTHQSFFRRRRAADDDQQNKTLGGNFESSGNLLVDFVMKNCG
jgi:hypothetical protein